MRTFVRVLKPKHGVRMYIGYHAKFKNVRIQLRCWQYMYMLCIDFFTCQEVAVGLAR